MQWAETALAPLGQIPARHHILLLDRLEAVSRGEITRLMVLMPPGSAKSTYVSMLFPPWWLARHPRSAVIAACHTDSLASHFGRRARAFIRGHGDMLGYTLAADERAANRFRTSLDGEYFATGVDGPIAGRRADLAIIDDPIRCWADADSASHRQAIWDWYRADLLPRLKPRGRLVLVMTRWHEDDLAGRLLDTEDGWQVLKLPALAEEEDPLGRSVGMPLWPEWEDGVAILAKRRAMGERGFAALFQQDPKPATGGLFMTERLVLIDRLEEGETRRIRAWDLAASMPGPGRDPDWTVGLRLERDLAGRFTVTDIRRQRSTPGEVQALILETARQDGTAVPISLPQDPGQAGKHQAEVYIQHLAGFQVRATPETGSKIHRATPLAAQIEIGNLRLLRAGWTLPLIEELRDFPHGNKDDQVDALSRAFAGLTETGLPARRLHIPLLSR